MDSNEANWGNEIEHPVAGDESRQLVSTRLLLYREITIGSAHINSHFWAINFHRHNKGSSKLVGISTTALLEATDVTKSCRYICRDREREILHLSLIHI